MKFDKRTMEEVVPADIAEGDYIVTRTTVGSHIEIAEGLVDTIHEFNGLREFQDDAGYTIYEWEVADGTDLEMYRLSTLAAKLTQMDQSKVYIGPSIHENTCVVFWYDQAEGVEWSGSDLDEGELGIDTKELLRFLDREVGFEDPSVVVKHSLENNDLNQIKEYAPKDFRAVEKAMKGGKIFVSADGKNLYTFEDGAFYTYVRHNYFGLKSEYKRTMHILDLPKGLVEHKVELKDIMERDDALDQLLYNVKTKVVYKVRKGVKNNYMEVDGSKVSYSYDLDALMILHLHNDLVQL